VPQISEQSEKAIKEFLQFWWNDLHEKVRETVAGAQIMTYAPRANDPDQGEHRVCYGTPDELYDQQLGLTLREIAAAAEGLIPTSDRAREIIYYACQDICELLWARPGMPTAYYIPDGRNPQGANWWETPIGRLVMAASIWTQGDELITVTQAAELAEVRSNTVSGWINRGRLQSYVDPHEPNPRKATRVRRSDVERLAGKRTVPRRGDGRDAAGES
jgi:hypothetical protein